MPCTAVWSAKGGKQESILTQASGRQNGIRRLFTIPPSGDGRGTETVTLIAPGIKTRDAIGIPPDPSGIAPN
ncbi:MAG: hypothetical protein ABIN99_00335 [Nitrosospira sp.]